MSVLCFLALATFVIAPSAMAQDVVVIDPVGLTPVNSVEVPALEAGMIQRVHVTAGEPVEAGALLAVLDDRDSVLAVELAEIDLRHATEMAESELKIRAAEAALDLAQLDLTRAEESIERYAKSISSAQLDRLRAVLRKAELDLEQARFEHRQQSLAVDRAKNALQIAHRGLERLRIVAPMDGEVVTVNARLGEWVEPGDVMLRIVDTSKLRAEGFVPAQLAQRDLAQAPAMLTTKSIDGVPGEFEGVVTFISPEVNRVDGKVRIWVDIDNSDRRLLPGTTGRISIIVSGDDQ